MFQDIYDSRTICDEAQGQPLTNLVYPGTCHTRIMEAKISMRESSPNAARATERVLQADVNTMTTPTTFQTIVRYSSSTVFVSPPHVHSELFPAGKLLPITHMFRIY